MKALIKFLKENVDEDEVCSTIRRMYQTRFPFHVANPTLHARLSDLMDEYGSDHDFDPDWWQETYELDDILFKIAS